MVPAALLRTFRTSTFTCTLIPYLLEIDPPQTLMAGIGNRQHALSGLPASHMQSSILQLALTWLSWPWSGSRLRWMTSPLSALLMK